MGRSLATCLLFIGLIATSAFAASPLQGSFPIIPGSKRIAQPRVESCNRQLLHQHAVRYASDSRDLVQSVREWLSPTLSLATTTNSDFAAALKQSSLAPEQWIEISEAAFDEFVRIDPELAQKKSALFKTIGEKYLKTIALPKDPRSFAGLRDSIFGRRAVVLQTLGARLDQVMAQLWKMRPKFDLRATNPEFFSEIPDEHRYADTYRALVQQILVEFEVQVPTWPRNWQEWNTSVNNFVDSNFADASQPARRFVITTLERVFLQTFSLPDEEDLLHIVASYNTNALAPAALPSNRTEVVNAPVIRQNKKAAVEAPSRAVAASVVVAKGFTVTLSDVAKDDLESLQPGMRKRVDLFLKIVRGNPNPIPSLTNGSWQYKKLKAFEVPHYSVRINDEYRIVFLWTGNHFEITNIDRTTSHFHE